MDSLNDKDMCVIFKNNHFSTVYKRHGVRRKGVKSSEEGKTFQASFQVLYQLNTIENPHGAFWIIMDDKTIKGGEDFADERLQRMNLGASQLENE